MLAVRRRLAKVYLTAAALFAADVTALSGLANEFFARLPTLPTSAPGGLPAGLSHLGSPAQFAAFMQDELKRWTPVIKATGVSLD